MAHLASSRMTVLGAAAAVAKGEASEDAGAALVVHVAGAVAASHRISGKCRAGEHPSQTFPLLQ